MIYLKLSHICFMNGCVILIQPNSEERKHNNTTSYQSYLTIATSSVTQTTAEPLLHRLRGRRGPPRPEEAAPAPKSSPAAATAATSQKRAIAEQQALCAEPGEPRTGAAPYAPATVPPAAGRQFNRHYRHFFGTESGTSHIRSFVTCLKFECPNT